MVYLTWLHSSEQPLLEFIGAVKVELMVLTGCSKSTSWLRQYVECLACIVDVSVAVTGGAACLSLVVERSTDDAGGGGVVVDVVGEVVDAAVDASSIEADAEGTAGEADGDAGAAHTGARACSSRLRLGAEHLASSAGARWWCRWRPRRRASGTAEWSMLPAS